MTFLKNVAISRPLMLVLDDLQVADTSSLVTKIAEAFKKGTDDIIKK